VRVLTVAIVLLALAAAPAARAAGDEGAELKARTHFAAGEYKEALDIYARLYAETLHPTYLTTNVTTALARGNDNYWTTVSGTLSSSGSNGVVSFRLTDVNNAMITVPQYPLLNSPMFNSTNQQFPLCPSP
jgi:hypothetical protein